MQVYPELQSGRFLIIADFEDPKYMELFQLISVSDEAKCVLDGKGGRAETGRGCLQFTAGSPSDTVVINNTAATNWYLKRDWRPYDLLMMNIHSPKRNLAAEITIAGGPPDERLAAHASISLQQGWNAVRLDLAEIGERIPLDDVQEIRLAVTGAAKPVELCFDDILLTGYREDLFGDSHDREAGLYVQRVGRRWKIGAAGPDADFEMTFANGQIVEWYNVAADPYRLRNLIRGTTLGPSPIVLAPPGAEEGDFSKLGENVVVRSRIVEMNAVRTVVTCEWRFVDDRESAQGGLDHRPLQRWVYAIYPSGQVYVAVKATARTESGETLPLGFAVTLASAPEDELETYVSARADSAGAQQTPAYATARSKPHDAFLLYVMDDAGRPMRITESAPGTDPTSASTERVSFIAVGDGPEGDVETWASHILLGSASVITDEEALARALDYASPTAPRLELGSFVSVDGDDSGSTGFDPTSGCHVIAPDRGRVRFVIDGGERPRFSPVFQIISPDNHEAWVYVDHLIFDRVARDAQGNLIFQLPGMVGKLTLVEVLFRRPERLSGT